MIKTKEERPITLRIESFEIIRNTRPGISNGVQNKTTDSGCIKLLKMYCPFKPNILMSPRKIPKCNGTPNKDKL